MRLLARLAAHAAIVLDGIRVHEELRALTLTDPLTGLPNRRGLRRYLDDAMVSSRSQRPLSLAVFDIDDFKAVNDRYGHAVGDDVLAAVARVLSRGVRARARQGELHDGAPHAALAGSTPRPVLLREAPRPHRIEHAPKLHLVLNGDENPAAPPQMVAATEARSLTARIGGDEFVAVLPGRSSAETRALVRRLTTEVRRHPLLSPYRISVSAGVAERDAAQSWQELMAIADRELYRSRLRAYPLPYRARRDDPSPTTPP